MKNIAAFPLWTGNLDSEGGMDLRDYFAAKAMQGLIANPEVEKELAFKKWELGEWDNAVSKFAYSIADAMMKAREKK